MEGPIIEGPKVWIDLNRKSETKVIELINKNKERSAWMRQYLQECRAKLDAKHSDPEFVSKTPALPKRGNVSTASLKSPDAGINRNSSIKSNLFTRASGASNRGGNFQSVDKGHDTIEVETLAHPKRSCRRGEVLSATLNNPDDAVSNKSIKSDVPTRASRASNRGSNVQSADESIDTIEVSKISSQHNLSNKNHKTIIPTSSNKSIHNSTTAPDTSAAVVSAECIQVTKGDQDATNAPSGIVDTTFDIGSGKSLLNSCDMDQFIAADVVEKSQEVNNIVEILQSAEEVDPFHNNMTLISRAAFDLTTGVVADVGDSRPNRLTGTTQSLIEEVDPLRVVSNTDDSAKSSIGDVNADSPSRSSVTLDMHNELPSDDEATNSEIRAVEDVQLTKFITSQKQFVGPYSENDLPNELASSKSRITFAGSSPAVKITSKSEVLGGYASSPVEVRVDDFEEERRDSAGLKRGRKSRKKSSIQLSLQKVSAARKISVGEVLAEQEINIVRKSPEVSSNVFTPSNARAPAGKVVRPGRKMLASGGRGVTPSSGLKGGSHTGSSASLMKSRSRLDIMKMNGKVTPSKVNTPNNMASEQRRLMEQRAVAAKQRRDEQAKKKLEDQRLKREDKIRRVQESRQKQESLRVNKLKNQEKEKEEKLATLKKREGVLKAEAKKRKRENELKLKGAEEIGNVEEERISKKDKVDNASKDVLSKEEDEEEDELRKTQEEEERKREQKREAERLQMEDEKNRAFAAQQEKILREREELRLLKERDTACQAATHTKSADLKLDKTVTLDQSQAGGFSSYDMTPARHELPPEPSHSEDNYGLEDLKSDEDTDDEDCPRKQVPQWAEGTLLRTALLKQCYMGPDLDMIFSSIDMPDLTIMFDHQRKRFTKRTSSACWENAPQSFKNSKRW